MTKSIRALLLFAAVACGPVAAQAAEIYGVEALSDRYVIRTLDTDHPGSPRELITIPSESQAQLRDLLQLDDGRIALLHTIPAADGSPLARLTIVGMPGQFAAVHYQSVSGLDRFTTLTRLLVGWGARYYGLTGVQDDRPPYQLITFFVSTRDIVKLKAVDLPEQARYANLTQCPDGKIYGTSLAPQQDTRLVMLDPESAQVTDLSPVTLNQRTLPSDVMGLACDVNGRLYVLANPLRRATTSLFILDPGSGAMSWMAEFAANKIALVKRH